MVKWKEKVSPTLGYLNHVCPSTSKSVNKSWLTYMTNNLSQTTIRRRVVVGMVRENLQSQKCNLSGLLIIFDEIVGCGAAVIQKQTRRKASNLIKLVTTCEDWAKTSRVSSIGHLNKIEHQLSETRKNRRWTYHFNKGETEINDNWIHRGEDAFDRGISTV